MIRLALLFQFVKRSIAWGGWLGLACGGAFGALLVLFSVVVAITGSDPAFAPPTPLNVIIQGTMLILLLSILFGILFGSVLGLALGLLDGLLMGALSITAFPSPVKPRPYRRVMGISVFVQTMAISLIGFRLLHIPRLADAPDLFTFIVVPIVAALAALYGSQKVAAWYLSDESKAREDGSVNSRDSQDSFFPS